MNRRRFNIQLTLEANTEAMPRDEQTDTYVASSIKHALERHLPLGDVKVDWIIAAEDNG